LCSFASVLLFDVPLRTFNRALPVMRNGSPLFAMNYSVFFLNFNIGSFLRLKPGDAWFGVRRPRRAVFPVAPGFHSGLAGARPE
jgi:hypothetical protein